MGFFLIAVVWESAPLAQRPQQPLQEHNQSGVVRHQISSLAQEHKSRSDKLQRLCLHTYKEIYLKNRFASFKIFKHVKTCVIEKHARVTKGFWCINATEVKDISVCLTVEQNVERKERQRGGKMKTGETLSGSKRRREVKTHPYIRSTNLNISYKSDVPRL